MLKVRPAVRYTTALSSFNPCWQTGKLICDLADQRFRADFREVFAGEPVLLPGA